MLYDIIKSICISFLLVSASLNAASDDTCLLLGPTPSFIIKPSPKLVTFSPLNTLTPNLLNRNIKPTGIQFSRVKKLTGGYYIAYFNPENKSLGMTSMPVQHCYPHRYLKKISLEIKQNAMVAEVTPNFLSSPATYDEPDQTIQWNFADAPGGIELPKTWLYFTQGSADVTVAVIDTGIMSNQALNPNVLPGVHFTNTGDYGVSARPTCSACPGASHGTLVAGIIAATGDVAYNQSIFGVSPRTKILPINVFTQFNDEATCGQPPCIYAYLSDQLNALHWLMGQYFRNLPEAPMTRAVNMSIGNLGHCPAVAQDTFNQAQEKSVSIVVSGGNQDVDAATVYPANCPGVISVAATGRYGERAAYSNWGETITLSAPGGNKQYSIYSTGHDSYRYFQGTSLAAPHVTGVIALMLSINPTLELSSIKKIIASKETTTPFPKSETLSDNLIACHDTHFPEKTCGVGILNAYKAVAKASGR